MFQQYSILLLLLVDLIQGNGIENIRNLGCWIREQHNIPAISSFEGQNIHVMDDYWHRSDPILSCAKAAAAEGFNVFAVSNQGAQLGGECFTSCSAAKDFAKYGHKRARCAAGTGGYLSMDVYSLDVVTHLGCIKNTLTGYAIPDMEASHPALFGQPHNRQYAIEKCAAVSRSKGYTVFGITKGGRCLSSGDAYTRYNKIQATTGYGANCQNEKGSEHSISVHIITGIAEFEAAITGNTGNNRRKGINDSRRGGRRRNRE